MDKREVDQETGSQDRKNWQESKATASGAPGGDSDDDDEDDDDKTGRKHQTLDRPARTPDNKKSEDAQV